MINDLISAIWGGRTFPDRDHQCTDKKDGIFLLYNYPKRQVWKHSYFMSMGMTLKIKSPGDSFVSTEGKKQI